MRTNVLIAPALIVCCCTLALSTPAAADTIYVNNQTGDDTWTGLCETWDGDTCGPKATIQAGIDAANDGDEVVLANGTYTGTGNKDLDFNGKPITVRSATGNPELCIIDCEQDGRGFYFHSGEGPDSVVEDLTVTNGHAERGGGVRCDADCSPTLLRCTITENVVTGVQYPAGAGVYCYVGSEATFVDCMISHNRALDDGDCGGGVYCYGSSPVFVDCTITGNYCGYGGGGLYLDFGTSAYISACVISQNEAPGRAGGIMLSNADAQVIDTRIAENTSAFGAAIDCWESSPCLLRCEISRNQALTYGSRSAWGGGVTCQYRSHVVFRECVLADNISVGNAGAIFGRWESQPILDDCLLIYNSAVVGGAILSADESQVTTRNCTLVGNEAAQGSAMACDSYEQSNPSYPIFNNCILRNTGGDEIWINDGSVVTVTHSNIQNGTGEPWFGEGCIDTDPLFVDPDGPDNDPETWEDNDYRLTAASPCIDAGDPLFEAAPGETDLDGNVRIWDGDDDDVWIVDMGAYEFGSYPVGDCNCDGAVTFDDIQPFIRLLD